MSKRERKNKRKYVLSHEEEFRNKLESDINDINHKDYGSFAQKLKKYNIHCKPEKYYNSSNLAFIMTFYELNKCNEYNYKPLSLNELLEKYNFM